MAGKDTGEDADGAAGDADGDHRCGDRADTPARPEEGRPPQGGQLFAQHVVIPSQASDPRVVVLRADGRTARCRARRPGFGGSRRGAPVGLRRIEGQRGLASAFRLPVLRRGRPPSGRGPRAVGGSGVGTGRAPVGGAGKAFRRIACAVEDAVHGEEGVAVVRGASGAGGAFPGRPRVAEDAVHGEGGIVAVPVCGHGPLPGRHSDAGERYMHGFGRGTEGS